MHIKKPIEMSDLNDLQQEQNLQIDNTGMLYLADTVKWAKFLAIVGFVMVGFIVIVALFAGSMLSSLGSLDPQLGGGAALGGGLLTVVYLIVAIIYFIPCLYLYRFAQRTGDALNAKNQELLNEGLGNLRSLYKFMGILTAIVIGLYVLAFIGALSFASAIG